MNEERRMILEMVKEGTISIEEAERLLEAIPEQAAEAESNLVLYNGDHRLPKKIIVRITDKGKVKVNVKLPFSLIKAGLKIGQAAMTLGAKYVNDAQEAQLLNAFKEIDVEELLECISQGEISLPYTMVDIDDEEGQNILVSLE